MTANVHLVIASWGGARINQPYPKTYLPDQLQWLARYRRNLVTQVTIVDAHTEDQHPDHEHYLSKALSLGYRVVRRHNSRMSYGGFSDVFRMFAMDPFTHWLFTEDDYMFIRDDWDAEFVNLYDKEFPEGNGYLCSLAMKNHEGNRTGTQPMGVVSTKNWAFSSRRMIRRGLPIRQGIFTKYFGPIKGTSTRFRSIFWTRTPLRQGRVMCASSDLPELLVPIQCLGIPKRIFDGLCVEVDPERL